MYQSWKFLKKNKISIKRGEEIGMTVIKIIIITIIINKNIIKEIISVLIMIIIVILEI